MRTPTKLTVTIEGPIKSGKTSLACAIADLCLSNDFTGTYVDVGESPRDLARRWKSAFQRMKGNCHVTIVTKTARRKQKV